MGKKLEWNVIWYDFNGRKISTYNILSHSKFIEDVKKDAKEDYGEQLPDYEEFKERVKKELQYYFWCKCEYEVIVSAWPPNNNIEEKKINCVIVKDLSRLGRDHIKTGYYMETYFPEKNVRFISILESYDSFKNQASNDSSTFIIACNDYYSKQIFESDPFAKVDQEGVGELMRIAIEKGKKTRPDIKLGICGEHGGEASTVEFCHKLGLTYVSCSPFRVPLARLAAAQAAVKEKMGIE